MSPKASRFKGLVSKHKDAIKQEANNIYVPAWTLKSMEDTPKENKNDK